VNFGGYLSSGGNGSFLSALQVVVLGYTETFVSTRLNGVASWEAAALKH